MNVFFIFVSRRTLTRTHTSLQHQRKSVSTLCELCLYIRVKLKNKVFQDDPVISSPYNTEHLFSVIQSPEKTAGYRMGFIVPLSEAATSNIQPSYVLTIG